MAQSNEAALRFLQTRRSVPAKMLTAPYPDHAALGPILTAAARSPDHGKLEPWRFIVLGDAALDRLGELTQVRGRALGVEPERIAKLKAQFSDSGCAVAVVSCPRDAAKVPDIEQSYSAGAVCLALLNAALASGWGANWLTGWAVHDGEFCRVGLGLDAHEKIAGIVHIGTGRRAPPDRPRPDLDRIVTWIDA